MAELGREHVESASGAGVCWKESTDRGKMGTKHSVLTDEHGLPLSVVLFDANTYGVKLQEDTLEHIVVLRPEPKKTHSESASGYRLYRQ